MTLTNLFLFACLGVFVGCYVYIFFGAKRLARARNERVAREAAGLGPPKTVSADPPVAAAPAAAEVEAVSPFVAAPDGPADDLLRIKGIGPKLSAMLAALGVFHYRQIADWTPAQMAAVDAQLGNFQGRPERDQWQSQARLLAAGDMKAYERVHGKLGPADSTSADPSSSITAATS